MVSSVRFTVSTMGVPFCITLFWNIFSIIKSDICDFRNLYCDHFRIQRIILQTLNLILESLSANKTFTDCVLEPPFGGRGSKIELKVTNSFIVKLYEG